MCPCRGRAWRGAAGSPRSGVFSTNGRSPGTYRKSGRCFRMLGWLRIISGRRVAPLLRLLQPTGQGGGIHPERGVRIDLAGDLVERERPAPEAEEIPSPIRVNAAVPESLLEIELQVRGARGVQESEPSSTAIVGSGRM